MPYDPASLLVAAVAGLARALACLTEMPRFFGELVWIPLAGALEHVSFVLMKRDVSPGRAGR